MATPFILLDEAKQYLNMTSTVDDAELTRFIAAACRACEVYRDESIGLETVTEDFRLDAPCAGLNLRRGPVVQVVSVENDDRSWSVDDLRIRGRIRRVVAPSDDPFDGDVEVVYQVGYSEVPADWKHASLVMLAHLWTTQRRSTVSAKRSSDDDGYNPGLSYSLPNRVQEMLGVRVPGVA